MLRSQKKKILIKVLLLEEINQEEAIINRAMKI